MNLIEMLVSKCRKKRTYCQRSLTDCLRIGGVLVAVSSSKAQMLDRNLYRMAGIEPERMTILVNKKLGALQGRF